MDRKKKNILGIGIAVAAILYLGATSFSNSISFYYEVSELLAKNNTLHTITAEGVRHKVVNVNGTIAKGSTKWQPEIATLSFDLTDGNRTIRIVSTDGMPGNYKEGIPAVATGTYDGSVFHANQVITKCPSKYGGDLEHGDHNQTQ